jgi:hypothetical protein
VVKFAAIVAVILVGYVGWLFFRVSGEERKQTVVEMTKTLTVAEAQRLVPGLDDDDIRHEVTLSRDPTNESLLIVKSTDGALQIEQIGERNKAEWDELLAESARGGQVFFVNSNEEELKLKGSGSI